jgi:predicted lipoprotein with Yx(FWY)xxD motif
VIGALAAAAVGAAAATLTVVKTSQNGALGRIVVSATGRTLYHDSLEPKHAIKCTGSCTRRWSPLLIARGQEPFAGPGVDASLLGTIRRPDGRLQVTYNGLALYLFAGDSRVGDVNGQDAGGIWHAIAPSGTIVTGASASSGATASTGSGTQSGADAGAGSSGNDPLHCDTMPTDYGCPGGMT